MILHAIELTYVGPFRDTVRLGPFTSGLNILAAPNESGKSTALRAAARALFDKHTTKGDELKSLQPAGTDLAPRIAVEFETRAGRFRIEKTFIQSPRSLLKQWQSGSWQPVADADLADQRLQELLHSSLPGRGATRPEHWGFLGFLWARQGEPAAWPRLEDEAVGQRIRARLARVELDPVIERLRTRLATAADAILTSGGQPKAGGPLRQAEDDLAAIETGLAALRQTRADLDSAHQRYQQALAAVSQLEKEHAEREIAAKTLRDQALAVERLRGELDALQQALATARDKLHALAADAALLARHRADQDSALAALARADETTASAEIRLTGFRREIDRQQAVRPDHENRLQIQRTEHLRLQALLKLRQSASLASALDRQVARAGAAAAEVAAIETRKARLPALTAIKVKKLEDLAEAVRNLQAQIQALGLTVELTPDGDATATVREPASGPAPLALPAATTTRLHRPQSLDLQLVGWGRVAIRSGARETQNAAADLAAAETALREALQAAEVPDVDAAREAVATRRELDALQKTAALALAEQLGDQPTLDALREAAAGATRRVAAQTAQLQPSADEAAASLTQLETHEARLAEALPAAEQALKALDQTLARLRTEERTAAEALQKAIQVAHDHRTRLRTLETQIADLAARHPDGIDAAKTAAQIAFTQAEARVAATKAGLPPDFEKLPERNRRATIALQQLGNELLLRRTDRDSAKGTLESLGGQGLYSRETELEEKKVEATLRRDAARAKGWSTRVAHDLIEHRKQAATKAVLTPLEQRLTAAFAELTGDAQRQVFLDEHLQISGLGRTREELYAFDHLSQGAKEQLLLCLRIAVAQELSAEEPQTLILDDVLVNTDSVRQERILDVLGALSDRLQILLLTCHPDRYRGTGRILTLGQS